MSLRRTLFTSAAAVALGGAAFADSPPAQVAPQVAPPTAKPVYSFSQLKTQSADAVKSRLVTWLQSVKRYDAAQVEAIWTPGCGTGDAALATIALGLPEVTALLADARSTGVTPSADVPALLKDAKLDPFVRANVAAAYAKALAGRRVFEESVAAAKLAAPEQLIDPASYYFYRAVAEHALIQRDAAVTSIVRLLDDVADAPDRYKVVATMMFFDLQQWSKDEKDLTNIGRLMDNSGRRLDLAKGGPQTQEIQKKIVFRLDEKIKELEAKAKAQAQGQPGDQPCPGGAPGGTPSGGTPNAPMEDSFGGTNSGPGQVDLKKLRNYEQVWGKLPEAERKKVTQDFIREMPPKFKPMIEDYFRSLNRINGFKP